MPNKQEERGERGLPNKRDIVARPLHPPASEHPNGRRIMPNIVHPELEAGSLRQHSISRSEPDLPDPAYPISGLHSTCLDSTRRLASARLVSFAYPSICLLP